jgi:hypothetical protein
MRSFERLLVGTLAGAARRLLAVSVVLAILIPAPQVILATVRNQGGQGVSSGQALTRVGDIAISGATQAEEARIRRCIGAIRYPLNTSIFKIDVYDNATPDMAGAAAFYEYPASVIHLKRGSFENRSDGTLGRLVAHEVGHMVDLLYFTDRDRAKWGELRGYPIGVSWDDRSATWDKRPAEDFAETFAQLTQPMSLEPMATAYGPVEQESALRSLLAKHVTNGAETLRSIQTERALNEITDQFSWARTDPLTLLVLESILIFYALSGAISGFGKARLQVLRAGIARHAHTAPATGCAPGTVSR